MRVCMLVPHGARSSMLWLQTAWRGRAARGAHTRAPALAGQLDLMRCRSVFEPSPALPESGQSRV